LLRHALSGTSSQHVHGEAPEAADSFGYGWLLDQISQASQAALNGSASLAL
jgi:hypothetical protein